MLLVVLAVVMVMEGGRVVWVRLRRRGGGRQWRVGSGLPRQGWPVLQSH